MEAVLGDSGDLVRHIESEFEAEAVIPSRKNAKRLREIDRELCKNRNKIKRFIGRIKHYRRVATRYEKTARNYMAFLRVASIVTLLLYDASEDSTCECGLAERQLHNERDTTQDLLT